MNETERLAEELEDLQEQMDDVVNSLGEIIIEIASDNSEFVCSACIRTAKELYQIFKNIAREEDCGSICEQYSFLTGSDLDD